MKEYFTVSELNDYISYLLSNDPSLSDCWLKGEISGCKVYQQSGHMYFNLKDREAVISCVMFKSRVQKLRFLPKDGAEILARGAVSVFSKQGKYQFYVQEMQLYGIGDLSWQLEQLKEKLQTKGYFAAEHKKPLPKIVKKLGIVSSQDGAAFRDILKIIRHRAPNLEIIISHTAVQGEDAPMEIAAAINRLNQWSGVDVIIVARGGGSLEDLMAFNHEIVVEAVYHSEIPIISGVGHEVDTTLIDLTADIRAATPTQAAQLAVPDNSLLLENIMNQQQRMTQIIQRKILVRSEELDRIMMKKVWRQPESLLKSRKMTITGLDQQLKKSIKVCYERKTARFSLVMKGLDSLSPLKVMQRGYAIVEKNGKVLRDIGNLQIGDLVAINLWRGRLQAQIVKKEKTTDGNQI